MPLFSQPDFDNHECVHAFYDAATQLKGFIAIHSTARGPAFGGCRIWPYTNEDAAVRDALRLSRGMSYKNALAELAYGGGKAVIIGDPAQIKSPALFKAFGRVVQSLAGRYITAEDVGTTEADMRAVATTTEFVSGIPRDTGYQGGDPSPRTARGVYEGMRAAVEVALGQKNLAGLTVAVQGAGNVGYHLCRLLHEAGAHLVVADIRAENTSRAVREFGAVACTPDEILSARADVLAPCALGGVLNTDTIKSLQVGVIAGAANNQLAAAADGERLHKRGILYAPDYVINAGGIISVAAERDRAVDGDQVMARIARTYDRTLELLKRAHNLDAPPHEMAEDLAREIIVKAANTAKTAAA